MYLGRLNDEQKNLFLDLCIHGANSNNDFADDEKEMVNAYCAEMQIPVRYTEETDLDSCVDRLIQISSKEEIRAILIEITALILADDICDEQEEVFMQKFIHMPEDKESRDALQEKFDELFCKMVEKKFRNANLSSEERAYVVRRISENLKANT